MKCSRAEDSQVYIFFLAMLLRQRSDTFSFDSPIVSCSQNNKKGSGDKVQFKCHLNAISYDMAEK